MGHAGVADPLDLRQSLSPGVRAGRRAGLVVDKGLHAEGDAVNAGAQRGFKRSRLELKRRSLQRDLHIGNDVELLPDTADKLRKERRREQRRRAAAEVDGVDLRRELEAAGASPHARRAKLRHKRGDVGGHGAERVHAGGKVAEGALGAAKRDRDVQAERVRGW